MKENKIPERFTNKNGSIFILEKGFETRGPIPAERTGRKESSLTITVFRFSKVRAITKDN